MPEMCRVSAANLAIALWSAQLVLSSVATCSALDSQPQVYSSCHLQMSSAMQTDAVPSVAGSVESVAVDHDDGELPIQKTPGTTGSPVVQNVTSIVSPAASEEVDDPEGLAGPAGSVAIDHDEGELPIEKTPDTTGPPSITTQAATTVAPLAQNASSTMPTGAQTATTTAPSSVSTQPKASSTTTPPSTTGKASANVVSNGTTLSPSQTTMTAGTSKTQGTTTVDAAGEGGSTSANAQQTTTVPPAVSQAVGSQVTNVPSALSPVVTDGETPATEEGDATGDGQGTNTSQESITPRWKTGLTPITTSNEADDDHRSGSTRLSVTSCLLVALVGFINA